MNSFKTHFQIPAQTKQEEQIVVYIVSFSLLTNIKV